MTSPSLTFAHLCNLAMLFLHRNSIAELHKEKYS